MALIEYETSLLYEFIIKKSDDPRIKLLLTNILLETKKHMELLKCISEIVGEAYPPSMNECERKLGKIFVESVNLTRSLRNNIQNDMSLLDVLKRLIDFEEAMSEEYVTEIYSVIKLVNLREVVIKEIVGYIASDERRHQQALKLAIKVASEN